MKERWKENSFFWLKKKGFPQHLIGQGPEYDLESIVFALKYIEEELKEENIERKELLSLFGGDIKKYWEEWEDKEKKILKRETRPIYLLPRRDGESENTNRKDRTRKRKEGQEGKNGRRITTKRDKRED